MQLGKTAGISQSSQSGLNRVFSSLVLAAPARKWEVGCVAAQMGAQAGRPLAAEAGDLSQEATLFSGLRMPTNMAKMPEGLQEVHSSGNNRTLGGQGPVCVRVCG